MPPKENAKRAISVAFRATYVEPEKRCNFLFLKGEKMWYK